MQAIKANVPNAMRRAFENIWLEGGFTARLIGNARDNGKSGFDRAFENKGWNASLSHSTYTKIKESCGL